VNVDRVAAIAGTLLAVTGIAIGFWLLGSPIHRRMLADDRQRSRDLSSIAVAIRKEAQPPAAYPGSLSPKRFDGTSAIYDPVSRKPYVYQRMSSDRFRLCATFALPSDPNDDDQVWPILPELGVHGAGYRCFSFRMRPDA
jgi:hypothetical protein